MCPIFVDKCTSTHGVHGNSGGKSAGKDVFLSGKGRKRLKLSGNRYSGFLREQDAGGSSPSTPTILSIHKGFSCEYSILLKLKPSHCSGGFVITYPFV